MGEFEEDAKKWYGMNVVLYNLVDGLKSRELAFLQVGGMAVRDLSGWSVSNLKQSMEAFGFIEKDYRMYKSVGSLVNTPIVSFGGERRKEDKQRVAELWKDPDGYDFVIDIDSDDIRSARKQAREICEMYREYGIPYYVCFSGNKGFHITVDTKWIPKKKEPWVYLGRLASSLQKNYEWEDIDLAIYDHRRFVKLPYSLDYARGEPLVVLPLNDEDLKVFKVEDAKLDRVLRDIRLYQRGVLEREGSQEGFKRLIGDI